MSSSRFLTDHSYSPTRKQEAICGKWSQISFQASKYFLLDFCLGSKLSPTAAAAGFRPLDICLLIKDFTSCLVELSFDIADKKERASKYKCQNQWLKEEGKSSEGDITADVELVLTAAPASPRCLQKEERWKGREIASVQGVMASTFSQFYHPVRTDKAVPGQRNHSWNHENNSSLQGNPERNTLHKAESP